MEFGRLPIFADEDVTEEQLASRNLILVGGPRDNSVAARLMSQMPVREENGRLQIGDEEPVSLDGRGYAFVHPNPEHPMRLVMVYASDVPQFYTVRRSQIADYGVEYSMPYVPPDIVVETVAQVDSAEDTRRNRTVRRRYFTHGWDLKQSPKSTITRHPADRSEEVEFRCRAFLRATGADHAFHAIQRVDVPAMFDYETDAVTWADIGGLDYSLVTFDVSGSDLVQLTRNAESGPLVIYPEPDPAAIEPERRYRVVAPFWMLWDLPGMSHYQQEDGRVFDDNERVERCLRVEWGVVGR